MPSQEHMTTPLWFWNENIDTMTEEKVREIVRESYYQSGYNGFGILPAFLSKDPDYVFTSEKFFAMYGAALDEASKLGMSVALYDEDGWPSGSAGGLVVKNNPEYGTRRLDKWEVDGDAGSTVKLPVPEGDYMGAVMMNNETKEVIDISDEVKEILDNVEVDTETAPEVTASSSYAGDYGPYNATDGIQTTRWNAASGSKMPQTLTIDFKQPQTFDKVEIIEPVKENPVLKRVTDYSIEYYDGENWVEVASGDSIGEGVTHTFDAVTVSQIRLVVKAVSTSSPSIEDIKIFNGEDELTPVTKYLPSTDFVIPGEEGNWKIMVFGCVIQGNKGVDYLNPDAIAKYIDYTYGEFYRRFPEYFGTTIKKSFYDEPTMVKFREAGTDGNRTWTPNFNAEFEKRYPGENPLLYYPAMFYDIGDQTQEARDKLYSARADMFAVNFIKQINDWCTDHGIEYMGHTYAEENVNPVNNTGDLMRVFKYQAIPGVDHIGGRNNTHQISRVVTSSAYNWDKSLVMSETYGAAGEGLPVEQLYSWAMDEFAAGVNYIVPHAIWYNNEVNVFYPPELSYRSEKFGPELRSYNEYVARLNQMLQGGRHIADIGIVYPIDYLESVFMMDQDGCNPADADYEKIITTLSQDVRRDFTFLHPEVIDEKCTVEGNTFHLNNEVNWETYHTIIIPGMQVISLSNLQKIKEFYDAGGKVISTTQLPYRGITAEENAQVEEIVREMFGVDPRTGTPIEGELTDTIYKNTNAAGGAAYFTTAPTEESLRTILDDANEVYDVEFPDLDVSGGMLTYIHKVQEGSDIYFIANSSANTVNTTVQLRGEHKALVWNPHDGTKVKTSATVTEVDGIAVTQVELSIPANTSYFLVDDVMSAEEEAYYDMTTVLAQAKAMDLSFATTGAIELRRSIAAAEALNKDSSEEVLRAAIDRLNAAMQNVVIVRQGNIALNANIFANTSYENGSAWGVKFLVDGSIEKGGWSVMNTNQDPNLVAQVMLDFVTPQNFDKIMLYPRQDYPQKAFPQDFKLQISNDGETWTTIAEETGYPDVTTNDPIVYQLDEVVNARYFRFECTNFREMAGTGGAVGAQLGELMIYNTQQGEVLYEHEVILQPCENGTITADQDIFLDGTDVTFTVTPNEGFAVSEFLINGEPVELVDGQYTVSDAREDLKAEASFYRLPTITAPESAQVKTSFNVTIETGDDVDLVRIFNESQMSVVSSRDYTMNEFGQKVWNISMSVGTVGTGRTFTVCTMQDGEPYEVLGTFEMDILSVPSSIVSFDLPEQAAANQSFMFTAVTSLDTEKLQVVNENGMKIGLRNVTSQEQDGRRIWTGIVSIGTSGTARTLTAYAVNRYGVISEDGISDTIKITPYA